MKNKKIIIPAMLLVLTAAAISPFISAQAATTDSNNETSTIQKVKNFIGHKGFNNKTKTPLSAEQIAARTAAKTAREAKIAAVNTALENSDYNAWVTAMAALNVNPNPNEKAKERANDNTKFKTDITQKITAANFPKLVEAYNLEKQLNVKLTELGINKDNGKGMGLGLGFGMGQWK
ncbi:MAG: hypothetical protein ACYC40_00795 [Patescibacteria group bacterium]